MARQKLAVKSNTSRELRRASLYRGLYARVARELDLELSHVRRVALGERRSRSVEFALIQEVRRIERALKAEVVA